MKNARPCLLAILELGGYPNLAPLYRRLGFAAEFVNSQRKAQSFLKQRIPDVIVAEYNFQSDFRDRTSNLETLMARLQRHPQVKVIVFFQEEWSIGTSWTICCPAFRSSRRFPFRWSRRGWKPPCGGRSPGWSGRATMTLG